MLVTSILKTSDFGTAPSDTPKWERSMDHHRNIELLNEWRLLPTIEEQHRKSPINVRGREPRRLALNFVVMVASNERGSETTVASSE